MNSDERRLARHRRYNTSSKGQARNRHYETAHPERKIRWSPVTGREVAELGPITSPLPEQPEHEGSSC